MRIEAPCAFAVTKFSCVCCRCLAHTIYMRNLLLGGKNRQHVFLSERLGL